MTWQEFEELARRRMSEHFDVELKEKQPSGFPKRWDMVSDDESVAGDAKYLSLVHREKIPPAKFMEIAGHVWLLEKLDPAHGFLVFGNQRRVVESWLDKYGNLVGKVEFYFLDDDASLERLK